MVKFVTKFLPAIFLILSIPAVSAQNSLRDDLSFIMRNNSLTPKSLTAIKSPLAGETNEAKMVMRGTIRFYQLFISSQDLSVCIFHPSCSRFGMAAIEKHGPLHGILMTSDRLQRCNGFGKSYYPIDPTTGKAIDLPIEYYYSGHTPPRHNKDNHLNVNLKFDRHKH
ncbi:MAG: membrane protein insertion efficiency factor YidD [candidate division Zixibacteria bacterium]|nr:membrane protein insertion efficiency factor YidD [candidate division Zixibacteria bacterium]